MAPDLGRELASAFAEEIGAVVGALVGAPATVSPGTAASGQRLVIDVRVDGPVSGALTAAVERASASALAVVLTGSADEPGDDVLVDTMRELFGQAAGSLSLKPAARGSTLVVEAVTVRRDEGSLGEGAMFAVRSAVVPVPLVVSISAGVAPPRSVVGDDASSSAEDRIGVILDIDLPLVIRFGHTELPLRSLTKLGPGSVIDLGRSPDDPVEVLVGNRVVARGEVVVVSGNYGIRILDVVSQRERMRSVEV